jgi:hypothetical protein
MTQVTKGPPQHTKGRREASRITSANPESPLPPVTKSAEQLERKRVQFREHLKATREGRVTAFESLINAVQNSLTVAEFREALKPRYYGDYRYKPVEGAPPAGSAPPPATQQPQGTTSQLKEVEEVATYQVELEEEEIVEGTNLQAHANQKEEGVEGAASRKEEGATYLRGPILRPLEGVKPRKTAAELLKKFATTVAVEGVGKKEKEEKGEEEDKDER